MEVVKMDCEDIDSVLRFSLVSIIEDYIKQIELKHKYIKKIDNSLSITMPKWVCDMFKQENLKDIKNLQIKISLAEFLLNEI